MVMYTHIFVIRLHSNVGVLLVLINNLVVVVATTQVYYIHTRARAATIAHVIVHGVIQRRTVKAAALPVTLVLINDFVIDRLARATIYYIGTRVLAWRMMQATEVSVRDYGHTANPKFGMKGSDPRHILKVKTDPRLIAFEAELGMYVLTVKADPWL